MASWWQAYVTITSFVVAAAVIFFFKQTCFTFVSVCVCAYTDTCMGSNVFLDHSSSHFGKHSLSLITNLGDWLDWLADNPASCNYEMFFAKGFCVLPVRLLGFRLTEHSLRGAGEVYAHNSHLSQAHWWFCPNFEIHCPQSTEPSLKIFVPGVMTEKSLYLLTYILKASSCLYSHQMLFKM